MLFCHLRHLCHLYVIYVSCVLGFRLVYKSPKSAVNGAAGA